jgi:hypothetical protein
LLDTITHAFEVFKTPYIVLKGTPIAKRSGFKLVLLVEPLDTMGEQHVDDLIARVEHVVLGD